MFTNIEQGEIMNRLPDNEFSNDIDGMPSADVMYHNYQKHYTEITCVKCRSKFWQKKDGLQSDICGVCHKWKQDFEAYLQRLESLKKGK